MKTTIAKHVFLVIVLSNLLSGSAFSAPILIDFDDRPGLVCPCSDGSTVPEQFIVNDEYLTYGVSFDSAGGGVFLGAGTNPISAPNAAAAIAPGPVIDFMEPVSAIFSIADEPAVVDFVRLTITSSSWASTLSAFDANGEFLGSVSGGMSDTLELSFSGRIHSVILSSCRVAFDNFEFDGLSPVPEPSTTMLMGLGIIGIGYAKYRMAQSDV